MSYSALPTRGGCLLILLVDIVFIIAIIAFVRYWPQIWMSMKVWEFLK